MVIFMLCKTYLEEAKYLILKGDEGLNLYIYIQKIEINDLNL